MGLRDGSAHVPRATASDTGADVLADVDGDAHRDNVAHGGDAGGDATVHVFGNGTYHVGDADDVAGACVDSRDAIRRRVATHVNVGGVARCHCHSIGVFAGQSACVPNVAAEQSVRVANVAGNHRRGHRDSETLAAGHCQWHFRRRRVSVTDEHCAADNIFFVVNGHALLARSHHDVLRSAVCVGSAFARPDRLVVTLRHGHVNRFAVSTRVALAVGLPDAIAGGIEVADSNCISNAHALDVAVGHCHNFVVEVAHSHADDNADADENGAIAVVDSQAQAIVTAGPQWWYGGRGGGRQRSWGTATTAACPREGTTTNTRYVFPDLCVGWD